MAATCNQEQTLFILSLLSNIGQSFRGTVEEIENELALQLNQDLRALSPQIGAWACVWGPAVYQAPLSSVAENVMYVARNDPASQLVIAIAGTNAASVFDWFVEDLWIGKTIPWPWGTPPPGSDPRLSAGTFTGLTILQFLRPGPGLPGAGQLLPDFLTGALGQPTNVTTTGHSLGGALSPSLGLWLLDTQSTWDPDSRATLSCQPSAGPTAGNNDFAAYYDSSLIGSRTTRIYNSLDFVPDAWNEGDLSSIPTLYSPAIIPDASINDLVFLARGAALGCDYTQIEESTKALDGTLNTDIITSPYPLVNFLVEGGYQHVEEYLSLLGITLPDDVKTAVSEAMGAPAAARAAVRLQAKIERARATGAVPRSKYASS
jgi:hypothetical protein